MKAKPSVVDFAIPLLVAAALLAAVVGCEFMFWRANHPDAAWWAFLVHG